MFAPCRSQNSWCICTSFRRCHCHRHRNTPQAHAVVRDLRIDIQDRIPHQDSRIAPHKLELNRCYGIDDECYASRAYCQNTLSTSISVTVSTATTPDAIHKTTYHVVVGTFCAFVSHCVDTTVADIAIRHMFARRCGNRRLNGKTLVLLPKS
jgi:hypothetical protein